MKTLFILFILPFLMSTISRAKARVKMPRPRIKAGTEITVNRYMPDADAFEITINREPAVGPNIATVAQLQRGLDDHSNRQEFFKRMKRDEAAIYVLKKDLPLLYDHEVESREKHHRH